MRHRISGRAAAACCNAALLQFQPLKLQASQACNTITHGSAFWLLCVHRRAGWPVHHTSRLPFGNLTSPHCHARCSDQVFDNGGSAKLTSWPGSSALPSSSKLGCGSSYQSESPDWCRGTKPTASSHPWHDLALGDNVRNHDADLFEWPLPHARVQAMQACARLCSAP